METRRSFLKVLSVGTGVVCLQPFKLMSSPKYFNYNLGETIEHVRHGQYSNRIDNTVKFPSWIKSISRNSFYKNGYSLGEEDLSMLKIQTLKNEFVMTFDHKNLWIEDREFSLKDLKTLKTFQKGKKEQKIQFLTSSATINKRKEEKMLFVLLKGEAFFNQVKCSTDNLIEVNSVEHFNIIFNSGSIGVLLSNSPDF